MKKIGVIGQIYFTGSALISIATMIEAGFMDGIIVFGASLIIYAGARAIKEGITGS